MRDIVLIDDNSKNQRAGYGASVVDSGVYDDILSHIERVNGATDFSFLKEAKCVLYHDSLEDFIDDKFVENSHEAKGNITDFIEDYDLPFVCFSDGHSSVGEMDSCGNVTKVKKSVFYGRLQHFLDVYRAEGLIEFRFLAHGKNYDKEKISPAVKSLFKRLNSLRPTSILKCSSVMPPTKNGPEHLRQIIESAAPALGMSYDEIINFIDDHEITVGEFKKRINRIFDDISKYGKNTYTWEQS